MPDFQQAFPRYKPFKCGAYWHLRSSGLYLATYDLIGGVTAGGKNPFFAMISRISDYFDSNYGSTHAAFSGLIKLGWLERIDDRKVRYIDHAEWASRHPRQCNERDILPWQTEPDPLLCQLFAIAGGRLRLQNGHMVSIRKFATEEVILELYRKEVASAKISTLATIATRRRSSVFGSYTMS